MLFCLFVHCISLSLLSTSTLNSTLKSTVTGKKVNPDYFCTFYVDITLSNSNTNASRDMVEQKQIRQLMVIYYEITVFSTFSLLKQH